MDATQLAADFIASQEMSTFNILIDITIYQLIESTKLNDYIETRLRSLSDSDVFVESVLFCIMNQGTFITRNARFVKHTAHDQGHAVTV